MRVDVADTDGPAGDYALSDRHDGASVDRRQAVAAKLTLPRQAQTLTVPLLAKTAGMRR